MRGYLLLVSVRIPSKFFLRGDSIKFKCLNLFLWAKNLSLPIYTRSFWFGSPIINLELVDRCLAVLKRLIPFPKFIIAERRGKLVDLPFLKNIDNHLQKGGSVIFLEGNLGGFDRRIFDLWDFEACSLGRDINLSNGKALWEIISDYVDRQSYLRSGKKILDNNLEYSWGKPVIYRGLKVPDFIRSGNHKKIKEIIENESSDSWIP